MKNRKSIQLIALWVLLIAMVFIYTDRDEYAWHYDASTIDQILETRQQANAAALSAQELAAAERADAAARTINGIWDESDHYANAPETRVARDEVSGLHLMWGSYDVTIDYMSPEPLALSVVSAGLETFIRDGDIELSAQPDGASASMRFTLTNSTENIMLACDLPEGAQITSIDIRKTGTGVFSADLAAYAALLGGVLSWLIVLSWDTRPQGKTRRRDALLIIFAAAFASLPCMMTYIVDGHDLFFHMNRIEGIASAMRCGQFPARIHASTIQGYGYAAPQFYPELFFYIPALMRNLGVSMMACVQIFLMLIHLASAIVCYESARRIFASRDLGVMTALLYTLASYRLTNVYTRAALGEALAMIFFPLLILALIEVLLRDERKWPLLAVSMTCIFMSHMLSTLLAICLCAIAAICCLPCLVKAPQRILACVKAAALTVLCSLWFALPFLSYSAQDISTNVMIDAYLFKTSPGILLVPFSNGYGDAIKEGTRSLGEAFGTQPGIALLVGCAALVLMWYMRGDQESLDSKACGRLPLIMLIVGVAAMLASTALFPWKMLCSLSRQFSSVFRQFQFPWRMLAVATPFLCMAAACGYLADKRHRMIGAATAIALSLVFSGYQMTSFVSQTPILSSTGYLDTRIGQFEYTYFGTQKSGLIPGHITVGGSESFTVLDYEKNGTSLSLSLCAEGGMDYVEVPLLYYPGYTATINGESANALQGDNGVLRIRGAFDTAGSDIVIRFDAPMLWRAAEAASLAGALLLIVLLRKCRQRA